ncbi:hypothetical protein D3C80_1660530 [compost metagenome]
MCIVLDQLFDHQMHRRAVGGDMVQRHDQHMIIFCNLQQPDSNRSFVLEVKWFAGLGFHKRQQAQFEIDHRLDIDLLDIERELALRMNDLYHLIHVQAERGSQRLVSRQQCLETRTQRLTIQFALEPQGDRQVVGSPLGVHLPEKPLALLRKRNRDDVEQ